MLRDLLQSPSHLTAQELEKMDWEFGDSTAGLEFVP